MPRPRRAGQRLDLLVVLGRVVLDALRQVGRARGRTGRAPLRLRADRSSFRSPPAPISEYRPAPLRSDRRTVVRIVQPRQRTDPLGHDPGASRLAGSEEYVQPDGTLPIGPNRLLPKKNSSGTSATYEGLTLCS